MEQTLLHENPLLCTICHQALLPSYYFCPNCGNNLKPAPLPTGAWPQSKLYLFSIILPMILFLTIGRWQGGKYLISKDQKTRTIGIIACTLLVLSTLVTIWLSVVTTKKILNESTTLLNSELYN